MSQNEEAIWKQAVKLPRERRLTQSNKTCEKISWLLIFYKFISLSSISVCLIRSLYPAIFPICDSIMHSPAVWLFRSHFFFFFIFSIPTLCTPFLPAKNVTLFSLVMLTSETKPLVSLKKSAASLLLLPLLQAWAELFMSTLFGFLIPRRTPPHLSHAVSPSQNDLPHCVLLEMGLRFWSPLMRILSAPGIWVSQNWP